MFLEWLGLDGIADRFPQEISLGEQQRCALARALAASPALLLADEPTGCQDQAWERVVIEALHGAAEAGTACLIATHSEEALAGADRVLWVSDGIVEDVARH